MPQYVLQQNCRVRRLHLPFVPLPYTVLLTKFVDDSEVVISQSEQLVQPVLSLFSKTIKMSHAAAVHSSRLQVILHSRMYVKHRPRLWSCFVSHKEKDKLMVGAKMYNGKFRCKGHKFSLKIKKLTWPSTFLKVDESLPSRHTRGFAPWDRNPRA